MITQARPRVLGKKRTIDGVTYDSRGYNLDFRTSTRFRRHDFNSWKKVAHRYSGNN
ncbi:MAG: hypothetical protein J0I20_33915 [Chloroflexi bacterium]|nr:hypothetical protein [Chloroflexota bacterium]